MSPFIQTVNAKMMASLIDNGHLDFKDPQVFYFLFFIFYFLFYFFIFFYLFLFLFFFFFFFF